MEPAWHPRRFRVAGGYVLNDETGTLWIINAAEIVVQWSKGSM
jgi:hypothetical protein